MQKKVAQNMRYYKMSEILLGSCFIVMNMTQSYFMPKQACNPRLGDARCRSKRNHSLEYCLGCDETLLGQFAG